MSRDILYIRRPRRLKNGGIQSVSFCSSHVLAGREPVVDIPYSIGASRVHKTHRLAYRKVVLHVMYAEVIRYVSPTCLIVLLFEFMISCQPVVGNNKVNS